MTNKFKFIYLLLLILGVTFAAATQAQTVTRDAQGNYIQIKKERAKKEAKPATNTGKTFTDTKGNKYPVMQSANGKLFVIRKSKTGKEYKQYITL